MINIIELVRVSIYLTGTLSMQKDVFSFVDLTFTSSQI